MQLPEPEYQNTIRLKSEIATCRRRLEELWNVSETTNADVLNIGNKLDKLINHYNRLNPPPKS